MTFEEYLMTLGMPAEVREAKLAALRASAPEPDSEGPIGTDAHAVQSRKVWAASQELQPGVHKSPREMAELLGLTRIAGGLDHHLMEWVQMLLGAEGRTLVYEAGGYHVTRPAENYEAARRRLEQLSDKMLELLTLLDATDVDDLEPSDVSDLQDLYGAASEAFDSARA